MTTQDQALALFGGLAGVLMLASAVGFLLHWRVRNSKPNPVVENLNARIKAWWVMVALVGMALLFGKLAVILLFAVASFMALREFITLTYTRRSDHWAILTCFFVVLPFQYWLVWMGWYGLYSICIPVYAFLILPIVVALRGDPTRFLERVAQVQWGLMIAVFCLSHVPALIMLEIPGFEGRNALLIAFIVLVAQGSDVLQYVWGKLIGRHQIAPNLSPSKTWEGFVVGVGCATALGGALWWITPFEPWEAAALALIICLMGFFGGLVMSAIKRDRGVKDWGWTIQGHGGVLDRLDSVVFSAPIFFHLTRFWWTV